MLLQFAFENYRSFRDEVIISLIASSNTEHPSHVAQGPNGLRILRSAVILGANASGKSNIVRAIDFCRDFICYGLKPTDKIPVEPFKLNSLKRKQPSKFQFNILIEDQVYDYGFVVTEDTVKEEWLYHIKSREALVFHRATSETGRAVVKPGALIKRLNKRIGLIAENTLPNQLFLTKARENNVTQLQPFNNWFGIMLNVITPGSTYTRMEQRLANEPAFREFVAGLLKSADTGIKEIKVKTNTIDFRSSGLSKETIDTLNEAIEAEGGVLRDNTGSMVKDDSGVISALQLQLFHSGDSNNNQPFFIRDESDGTIRLMELAPVLTDIGRKDQVFIVDELTQDLHTQLSRKFLEQYFDCCAPNSRTQLLFTTHDTSLMNLFRRDEILLLDKDDSGNSSITSVHNLKVRNDLLLDKAYLDGRLGGVPIFRTFHPEVTKLLKNERSKKTATIAG